MHQSFVKSVHNDPRHAFPHDVALHRRKFVPAARSSVHLATSYNSIDQIHPVLVRPRLISGHRFYLNLTEMVAAYQLNVNRVCRHFPWVYDATRRGRYLFSPMEP
jgi:hypothetical protein